MSADNWGICPRCKERNKRELAGLAKKLVDGYGKISREDYEKLLDQEISVSELRETLREDYELWVNEDGLFYVSYGCSCNVCGFEFNFAYEENVLEEEK